MGNYISVEALRQFMASAKALSEGKCQSIVCSKRAMKLGGKKIDQFHRKHRLMSKLGYFELQEKGNECSYTLTPSGLALYDFVKLSGLFLHQ